MTNRLFALPESNTTNPNSEPLINFDRERHLTFAADLDQRILDFERLYAVKPCAPLIPQQRISTATSTARVEVEPCLFDDLGLVQGLEIDVRWM